MMLFSEAKAKAVNIYKWSVNSESSSYFSLSPADWIGFQMFDDKGKKQPWTFTLGSRGIKYQI